MPTSLKLVIYSLQKGPLTCKVRLGVGPWAWLELLPCIGGEGRGFKWKGWLKKSFGCEIFDFGVGFWSRYVWGVLFEARGIFWCCDFCPHLIIPVTWNLEYPPPPPNWACMQPVISILTSVMIKSWAVVLILIWAFFYVVIIIITTWMEAQIKWSYVVSKANIPCIELLSPVTNCHLHGQMT